MVSLAVAGWVTWIDNLIVRQRTGQVVDGEFEVTKDNVGDGRMQGVEAAAGVRLGEIWSARAGASYVAGRVDTVRDDGTTSQEPLSRLPPIHGDVKRMARTP